MSVPVVETPGSDSWSDPGSLSETYSAQSLVSALKKSLEKLDWLQARVSYLTHEQTCLSQTVRETNSYVTR